MHSAGALQDLARRSLADIDSLVQLFIDRLRTVSPYSSGVVPVEILRPDTEGSFELILRLIADLPVPPRLENICERIGRNRARVGVPLDVLLGVIRTDFTLVWENLLKHAEPEQYPDLVRNAGRVWIALERYTVDIQRAYLDEAAVLARERNQERTVLVAGFLATDGSDPSLSQVATALGMQTDASFLVAAVPHRAESVLHRAADHLRARRVALHVQSTGLRSLLIAQLPAGGPGTSGDWLKGVPSALGPTAVGLAAVPRVAAICDQIVETLTPEDTGPVTLLDRWPALVVHRVADLMPWLRGAVLPDPKTISESENERLIETVETYLRTGSVAATASSIYCHRNTVINRLNRFAEITGHDVTLPVNAAAVTVALAGR
jgi:hypothetical protein